MKIEIIPTKDWLYDKCENMEQLYDKYYYPLLVENKELKKKYENAVADYETTMAEKNKLKKQVKDKTEDYKRMKDNFDSKVDIITKIDNQQKEFIEWLEAMNRMYQNEYKDIDTAEHYNCVLQKYKSIIGDDK